MSSLTTRLTTRRGTVAFPAFLPVTTLGDDFPLDRLVLPYLPRLAAACLVSYHYARVLRERPAARPPMPLFIDSGGFALLRPGARWEAAPQGGRILNEDGAVVDPQEVLRLQVDHAEIGATLDLPIPPGTDPAEAGRRLEATLRNADWALRNSLQRPDFALYGVVPAWEDLAVVRSTARALAVMECHGHRFAGLAIGGLVPRQRDQVLVDGIVATVREEWSGPIHAFGIGQVDAIRRLAGLGVDSFDSSSYVRYAVDGRSILDHREVVPHEARAPLAVVRLALRNLAALQDPALARLPLAHASRPLGASQGRPEVGAEHAARAG